MTLADRPVVAYVATLALALAIVSPAIAKSPRDSFPLSTFPMFAEGRKDATVSVEHAVAIDREGRELPIPPRVIGSDEVLQARATIARAVRKGPKAAMELCHAIARQIRDSTDLDAVRSVELRTTKRDAVAWFSADDEASRPPPISMKRHATCPVDFID